MCCLITTVRARCVAALMLPTLCTSKGRGAIYAIIIGLLLSGPIQNIYSNSEETSNSMSCSAEVSTRIIYRRLYLTIHDTIYFISHGINSLTLIVIKLFHISSFTRDSLQIWSYICCALKLGRAKLSTIMSMSWNLLSYRI